MTRINVLGGSGSDIIRLEASGDRFPQGVFSTVVGGLGTDNLNSPTRPNRTLGGKAGDTLNGDFSRDHLDGGAGSDFVSAFAAPDVLVGGLGRNDTLNGDLGNDSLDAADGLKDSTIDCSEGIDAVVYDVGIDPAPFGCES